MFCWRCFYQLPLDYLNVKECPVCDREVTDTVVIPIYGNGDDCNSSSKGVLLPPRPNAKRVESFRQKIINRGIPLIPWPEKMEHTRIGLQALAQGDEFGLVLHTSEMPPFDDVDSFFDTTSLRRNRRRSFQVAEVGPSPGARASLQRSQTVNPTEVVTSASATRRRREDVNSGPRTMSRRRRLR